MIDTQWRIEAVAVASWDVGVLAASLFALDAHGTLGVVRNERDEVRRDRRRLLEEWSDKP